MIIGTTPAHTFTYPFDLGLAADLEVYYSQNNTVVLTKKLTDSNVSHSGRVLTITLTQAETFLLTPGMVLITSRVRDNGGMVSGTEVPISEIAVGVDGRDILS